MLIGPYGSLTQDNIIFSFDVSSSVAAEALVRFIILRVGRSAKKVGLADILFGRYDFDTSRASVLMLGGTNDGWLMIFRSAVCGDLQDSLL